MGDFGAVDWKIFEKFILSFGVTFRRMKGDHRMYVKPGLSRPLVVPQYNPIPPHIIMNNLRVLGVKKEALLDFLDRN